MKQALGFVPCLVTSNNTGFGKCIPSPGQLVYDIAVPKGWRAAIADLQPDTLEATLIALLTEDDPAERGYLLGAWVKVEDMSAEESVENMDTGVDVTLADGAYKWKRRTVAGGLCGHDGIRKFNRAQDAFDLLHIFRSTGTEAKYYVMGTKIWNSTDNDWDLKGCTHSDMWSPKWGITQGNTSSTFFWKTTMFDVRQLNEDRAFVATNVEIADLPRIMDINLSVKKVSTGIFEGIAPMTCGGDSAANLFPTSVDDAFWVCVNENDAVVPMTGVTKVAGRYRFALDTTDANYTGGTKFRFYSQPLSVTAASPFDVEWVESNVSNEVAK